MVVGEFAQETDLVVIGGSAGGLTAALRAAELGVGTVLVRPAPDHDGETLAVIRRETNSWRWPIFAWVYMTSLGYLGALSAYQLL